MTSGITTRDFRQLTPTDSGTFLTGNYFQKSWSGGNKVVPKPVRNTVSVIVGVDSAKNDVRVTLDPSEGVWRADPKTGRLYRVSSDPTASRTLNKNSKGELVWSRYRAPVWKPKRAYNEVHPYSMNVSTLHEGVSSYSEYTGPYTPPDNYTHVYTYAEGGLNTNRQWTSNDDLALIGKLREKVAGSDFNLGIFLGEGNKALDMIAAACGRILKGYTRARRGDMLGATRALIGSPGKSIHKKIANNWLELQYGWLPLLQDVKGGAEFLAHHLETPIQLRVVARRKIKSIPKCLSGDCAMHGYRWESGQIIYLRKEVNVPQLVGLMDPLSVAWELVPFSFVLDWFLPIGSWLSARGLSQAMTGTFVTTKRIWVQGYAPYRIVGSSTWGADYYKSYYALDRTISSELDVPLPSIKPLNKALSWKRAANALALLAQPSLRR